MVEVELTVPTSRDRVFAVLADGWTFASWVVGASHIRAVDEDWPAKGNRIHHSVGPWPLQVEDSTEVVEVRPPAMLELDARMWPFGAARVRLELAEDGPDSTRVAMSERAVRGPGRMIPESVQAVGLVPRNRE